MLEASCNDKSQNAVPTSLDLNTILTFQGGKLQVSSADPANPPSGIPLEAYTPISWRVPRPVHKLTVFLVTVATESGGWLLKLLHILRSLHGLRSSGCLAHRDLLGEEAGHEVHMRRRQRIHLPG
jgi:hypothetical protein